MSAPAVERRAAPAFLCVVTVAAMGALLVGVPLCFALRAQTLGAVADLGPREAALAEARALMARAASPNSASPAPATPALARAHFSQVEASPTSVRLRKLSFDAGSDFSELAAGEDPGDGVYWTASGYTFGVSPVGSR